MSGIDRRTKERISSEQTATIYLQSGEASPCVIADFCDTGMLITFKPNSIRFDTTQRIIRVSFRDEVGRELFVNAEPVYVNDHESGIRYVNKYTHVVDYLRGRFQKAPAPKVASEHEHLVEQSLVITHRYANDLFQELSPKLVETFREEALASTSDQLSNARMAIAVRFEKHADTIRSKFLTEVMRPESLAPPLGGQQQETHDLSIIEKGEFEDWLLSRVLIAKLESNCRSELLSLKMRTDSMEYRSPMRSGSPLGPERLVYGFRAAVHSRLGDVVLERKAFKLLEKEVESSLEMFYAELNAFLSGAGVLTHLTLSQLVKKNKYEQVQSAESESVEEKPTPDESTTTNDESGEGQSFGTQSVSSGPAPEQSSSANAENSECASASDINEEGSKIEANAPSADNSAFKGQSRQFAYGGQPLNHDGVEERNLSAVDLGEQTPSFESESSESGKTSRSFGGVRRLLSKLRSRSAPNATDAEQGPKVLFSENEVDHGLSSLHGQEIRAPEKNADQLSLLDRVMESLPADEEGNKQLADDQKDRIDVVDRFFGSLQVNPRLSSEGKQHLFKLEIPVLRQLLENESFFDDKDSPLRDVLNRIAKLGTQGGRLGRVGHQKIENLVTRINDEYDENKGVVEEVKAALDDLLARQHALYLKNVERVAAAADGAHRVEESKKLVQKLVSKKIEGKEIPRVLQTLLSLGWIENLNFLLLKHGENSSAFRQAVGLIDALVRFGKDPSVGFDAKFYVPLIQEGLKSAPNSVEAIKSVRTQLKQLILDAPENRHEMVSAKPLVEPEELEVSNREQRNLEKSKTLASWIRRAKSISLNAWLKYQKTSDAEVQFIRLVWIARGYSKFVFVNHQGMKVIELGLFKLSEHLKEGKAIPDPSFNEPVVKQGLDDMVKDVYEKLAFDSSHDDETGLQNEREFIRTVRKCMQVGERTNQCSLLYLRCLNGELSEDDESQSIKAVVALLSSRRAPKTQVARLNRYDFALFSIDVKVLELVADIEDGLAETVRELNKDIPSFRVLRSEVLGYLGFHNIDSLLESARASLQQVEAQDSAPDSTKVELLHEVEPEELAEGEQPFDASDSKAFEVFQQETRKLNFDSTLPEHMALRCVKRELKKRGHYFSSTGESSQEMNAWWLAFLARTISADGSDRVFRIPLSAYCLQDDSFKEELIELLHVTNMTPERVWFDLYNSGTMVNEQLGADIIRELQVLGFRFGLDAYGTPDCPAHLLQALPVDTISLNSDMLVKPNADEDREDESLIDIAHHFGKEVLVTDIDSAIGLQRAERQGADFAQGERVAPYSPFE